MEGDYKMKTKYSRKQPDMSRNKNLAGKTVYSCGMNVIYDKNGYAVGSYNPDNKLYKGTTRSLHAQPIEDALAGKPWTPPDLTGLVDWNNGSPDYGKKIGDPGSESKN